MKLPAFEPLADDALVLRFGEAIDDRHNGRALEASRRLREQNPSWLGDNR